MIKIEIYAETAAEVRKHMLEFLNLEANQAVAITINPAATTTEAADLIKAASRPKASKPATPPPAAPQPETPAWIASDPPAPPEELVGQQTELATPDPVTASDLREVLGELSEKKGQAALKKLLAHFEATQFSKIAPTQYAEAMAMAKEMLK
jgi:hypothetical protein